MGLKKIIIAFMIISSTIFASDVIQKPKLIHSYRAHELLSNAYKYIQSQDRLSFRAVTTNEDIYKNSIVVDVTNTIRVHLARDNRFRIDVDGDSKHRSYIFNSGKFIMWDREYGFYGELETPKTIDKTLDYIYDNYGITSPLANLLYSDLTKRVVPKAKGYYFGIHKVNGISCYHIGFSNKQKELQVWIQLNGEPLILKFTVIDKSTPLRLHSSTVIDWRVKQYKRDPFVFEPSKFIHKIPVTPVGGR